MSKVNTEKLLEDLQLVVEDVEALLKVTAGQAGEKVAEVRARAQSTLHAAKERLAEVGGDAGARVRETAGRADDYVRTNPWASVAIGAGIGLLIGLVMGRDRGRG